MKKEKTFYAVYCRVGRNYQFYCSFDTLFEAKAFVNNRKNFKILNWNDSDLD